MSDQSDVGQGRKYNDPIEKHDADAGTYNDPVVSVPTADKLPTVSMPQGPDPSPFKIGPMTPGGREG